MVDVLCNLLMELTGFYAVSEREKEVIQRLFSVHVLYSHSTQNTSRIRSVFDVDFSAFTKQPWKLKA